MQGNLAAPPISALQSDGDVDAVRRGGRGLERVGEKERGSEIIYVYMYICIICVLYMYRASQCEVRNHVCIGEITYVKPLISPVQLYLYRSNQCEFPIIIFDYNFFRLGRVSARGAGYYKCT